MHNVAHRSHKAALAAEHARRAARGRLIAKVTFSVLSAIIAVIVWRFDKRDGHVTEAGGIPLFTWCLLAAAFFPVVMAASLLVTGFVFLLELALTTVFENANYVLMGLRTGLQCGPPLSCRACLAVVLVNSRTRASSSLVGSSLPRLVLVCAINPRDLQSPRGSYQSAHTQ